MSKATQTQASAGAVAGIECKLLTCWIPHASWGLWKMASPFCPQNPLFKILKIITTALLKMIEELNFQLRCVLNIYLKNIC